MGPVLQFRDGEEWRSIPPLREVTPPPKKRRPGTVPVAMAAVCAALNVWFFSQADWNGTWASFWALFLVEELWAAWARTGGTLSERFWAWLGINPRRPWRQARIAAAGIFLVEFTLHVVTGGQTWWSGGVAILSTAVPVACVVVYALVRERRVEA